MALLGNFKTGYVKTGENMFMRWSAYSSYIPGLGAVLAPVFGTLGTAIDSGKWLLRGKLGSAATAAAAGTVATLTHAAGSATGLTWGSFALTGRSLGTHTRKLTEATIGVVAKPTVLQSYQAGIGSTGMSAAQAGPGKFASRVADERGVDRQQLYNNYMNGDGGVHVNELNSANLGR